MEDSNDRTIYGIFSNPFTVGCASEDLNIPPMPIDNSSRPNKRACCTPDPLSDAIYITFGNYVNILTSTSDFIQVVLLTSDYTNPDHTIMG